MATFVPWTSGFMAITEINMTFAILSVDWSYQWGQVLANLINLLIITKKEYKYYITKKRSRGIKPAPKENQEEVFS